MAAQENHLDVVNLLLNHGANQSLTTKVSFCLNLTFPSFAALITLPHAHTYKILLKALPSVFIAYGSVWK